MHLAFAALLLLCQADVGNRLTYLDGSDPYYVSRTFPRLTTPQWVGEPGVEAVITLGIDDMRGHEKWERYLRPILERLKKIDGRAPVSIMTCKIDPRNEHLQKWLQEGLSLEIHTYDHPCPILEDGDFVKAKGTYDRCVDLLSSVPFNKPVAFRVPCCDSLNTPSPRFYAEIFNRKTPGGNFLSIDTSVFNIMTSEDLELPKAITFNPEGEERFLRYVPKGRSFVNTIRNYPYPFVIGGMCWEFPCATPSDWQAHFLQKPNNPVTVRDWKAGIDATVIKQGTFNLVFHPHGWIKAGQIVELIDYVVSKHGKKVKFLTFKEAKARLDRHLLGGNPLRTSRGRDNWVRLLDVNNDGHLDVIVANPRVQQTRVWDPKTKSWTISSFPEIFPPSFAVLKPGGNASLFTGTIWHFDGTRWMEDEGMSAGISNAELMFRDLDGDGRCEALGTEANDRRVMVWSERRKQWIPRPWTLPAPVLDRGQDMGLRFVDLNRDGRDDIVFSNDREWGIYVFESMTAGWRKIARGIAGEPGALPRIVRGATNNGAWFHSNHLWVQNEDTAKLPNLVDRRTYEQLLKRR